VKKSIVKKFSFVISFVFVLILLTSIINFGALAHTGFSGYVSVNSSSSYRYVYNCASTSSLYIGAVWEEYVDVFWKEGSFYYIEYAITGGYKRGYTQKTNINKTPQTSGILNNGIYYIKNVKSGKYLDVAWRGTSNGTNVWQWGFHGGTNQQWKVEYISSEGLYKIHPQHATSMNLHVNGTFSEASNVDINNENTLSSKWNIVSLGSGEYKLMSACSERTMAMAVVGASNDAGADVKQYYYTPTTDNDEWVFETVVNLTKDYGSSEARGEVLTGSNLKMGFTVNSTATYIIETAQPNAPNGVVRDTILELCYLNGNYITSNDDINSNYTYYSRITITLNPGLYFVKVYEYPNKFTDVACYFSVYRQGSLIGTVSKNSNYPLMEDYSNLTYDFKKIGNYTDTYNCLAYALGITNDWVWEWWWGNPTLAQVDSYMSSQGYTKIPYITSNCVVAYGTEASVGHFSKNSSGIATAKLGSYELVEHISAYAYYSQSTYGNPIAYYTK